MQPTASNPASIPASTSSASKPASRPFKKFYCDDKEVFRLPGVAFKIWMYHYAREGKARQSWPTVDTICDALDINKSTLQRWRKFLVQNGWLEKVGEHRRLDGEFNVPIFKVKRGTVDEIISDGRQGNRVNRRRKNHLPTETNKSSATGTKISSTDRDEIIIHEVDSGLLDSEKVDSGLLESRPTPLYSLKSESKPQASNGYSPEEREALHEMAREHDRTPDDVIAQLVTDEIEVLDNLPAELTDWVAEQKPLDTPLIVVEAPSTGDGLCLPYTENGHEYTEATASENRERAVNILYGGGIKDRTQLLIDHDLVWELDIAYGQGACLGLAIMVSELCPEHKSFIYHHLGNLMVEKARSPKPEIEPVRKMDIDTEDGDVSELDTIPELDLATTPELDVSNIPEWTA
jgi:hypothetical protein